MKINSVTLLAYVSASWGVGATSSSSEECEPRYTSYAPVPIDCPSNVSWIRSSASGISPVEAAWVKGRKSKILPELRAYLSRLRLKDFDVDYYISKLKDDHSQVPTIGVAISGGAWASALTGTGLLRALDARFGPSKKERVGGILQSLTYISGLSGGSWPVMSLATNNFPEIDDMVASWKVDVPRIFDGPSTSRAANTTLLFDEITAKFDAGYDVSYMDFLGRSFGYEFLPGPHGGIEQTVSGVTLLSEANDAHLLGLEVPYQNATVYEFNPLEFGAWNGPRSFFPMHYLGTKMADGQPVDRCLTGFDRASWVMGAVADAVNYWILGDISNGTLGGFSKRSIAKRGNAYLSFPLEELQELNQTFNEAFGYKYPEAVFSTVPNPFASMNSTEKTIRRPSNLTLIDMSEMLQGLPLWTQSQPARKSDLIIAWDNGEDAHPFSWNNGTNLYGQYLYSLQNKIPFPIVPKPATFINRNMTHRPTFFGCDAHLTTSNDTRAPIILYHANAPYSSYTNYSGFTTTYSNEQMAAIMTNSFNIATQGNGTLDQEWPECLGCAMVDRSLGRLGLQRTEQCKRCFEKYCWDGTSDDTDPPVVDISLVLNSTWTYAEWNRSATNSFWPETGVESG